MGGEVFFVLMDVVCVIVVECLMFGKIMLKFVEMGGGEEVYVLSIFYDYLGFFFGIVNVWVERFWINFRFNNVFYDVLNFSLVILYLLFEKCMGFN